MKSQSRLYLIDPKRIGLAKFQHLPHVDGYATEITDIIDMMQEIIDELADLMINGGVSFRKSLQSLNQLCRAANIHVIVATQSPAKKIIPAEITINFTCKIALYCDDVIQSRQILDVLDAELLPKYGKALLKIDGKDIRKINVPYLDSETLKNAVAVWNTYAPESEPECRTASIDIVQTKPVQNQPQIIDDVPKSPLEKLIYMTAKTTCFITKHLIKTIALVLGFIVLSGIFHVVSEIKMENPHNHHDTGLTNNAEYDSIKELALGAIIRNILINSCNISNAERNGRCYMKFSGSKVCPQCRREIPKESRYCLYCGKEQPKTKAIKIKAKKRSHGTGTISRDSRRNKSWVAHAPSRNGKRIYLGSYISREEAQDALKNFIKSGCSELHNATVGDIYKLRMIDD